MPRYPPLPGTALITAALQADGEDTEYSSYPLRTHNFRGHNVTGDFDQKLKKFDKTSRQRLRYYSQYTRGEAATEGVKLWVRGPSRACRSRRVCASKERQGMCADLSRVCPISLRAKGVCGGTENDADSEYYRRVVREMEAAGPGPAREAAARGVRLAGGGAVSTGAAASGIEDELGLDGADAMGLGASPSATDSLRAARLEQVRRRKSQLGIPVDGTATVSFCIESHDRILCAPCPLSPPAARHDEQSARNCMQSCGAGVGLSFLSAESATRSSKRSERRGRR